VLFNISNKAEVNFGAAADLFSPKVDLHCGRVLGVERLVREVSAEHHQHIAIHHCEVAGRKSQQSGHADVERIVILDEFFPAIGVQDWRLQLAGELDQLRMSARTTGATKNRDLFRSIQEVREDFQFLFGGANRWRWFVIVHPWVIDDGLFHGDVSGYGDNRNTALGNRGLHRDFEHSRHLLNV
jgi:hypothetical protein